MPDLSSKNIKKAQVDQAALGEILGITPRWVRQLTTDGAIKRNAGGKYPLTQAVQGYLVWLKASQERVPASDAKEAVLFERARSLRLQNDEREHRLIQTEEAVAALDELVGIFSTELSGFPARLTRNMEDRRQIAEHVDAIRNRAADKLAQRAAELRTNGSIEVPVEVDDDEA
jgi:phage terminase Nu1 subunit (DNA packaging protein)